MQFKEWLILNEMHGTSTKTGLYPLGYDGIGLYPCQYYIPYSGDAIYYVSADKRLMPCGEGPPFKISHIPSKPPKPKWPTTPLGDGPPSPMVYSNGEAAPWKISHIS